MDSQSVRVEVSKPSVDPKSHTVYKGNEGQSAPLELPQTRKEGDQAHQGIASPSTGVNPTVVLATESKAEPIRESSIKIAMTVDPHDSPERPEVSGYKTQYMTVPGKYMDDVDEGAGIAPAQVRKAMPRASQREPEQLVAVEKVPMPQIQSEGEYSLIQEGDSLVKQMDDPNNKGQKASTAMTVVNGAIPRAPGKKKSHKTTFEAVGYEIKGNTKLMAPINQDGDASHYKQNSERGQTLNQSPGETKPGDPSVKAPSQYVVQRHGENPQPQAHPETQKVESKPVAQQEVVYVVSSEHRAESPARKVENPNTMSPPPQEHTEKSINGIPSPYYPTHPRPDEGQSPVSPGTPIPAESQAPIALQPMPEMMEVHSEDLNGSNVANLDDSLNQDNKQAASNGNQASETMSKFQNNFDKYVKDEAGMSVFAPADIDYSDRANRAEAHLMKYDSDIRARYEKVARGMQQVYSNIQKINIGAHESATRFRNFFQNLMTRTEKLAAMYPLPEALKVMIDRKDMGDLKPAGNIHILQQTFETMKLQRGEHSSQVLIELREMRQEYQTKIVDENFYEEGIDQKSTIEMQKGIEKGFDSIFKRNKQCIEQFGSINKKMEENKIHFEKKKKFKNDTFEDYINYLRSVRKLWMFIADNQDKLLKYWERVRIMEELRIKAITHILQRYFVIEEKLSSASQNTDALKRMNSQISPEGMAAAIYSDKGFLNSPLLESIHIKLDSIKVFTSEIKKLKNTVPDIVEFALWDYTNLNTLVKSVNTPLRIFRSNENTLYIYHQVKDRSEVPMEAPLFRCKVNSLLLHFDERNNCIELKGSGFFTFNSFTFNLREHQDAKEFEAIVNKFCKNSKEAA
jgi:hypothetical protein